MINTSLKNRVRLKTRGAATLITAIMLLVISSLIIIFAANFGRMQNKITANSHRNSQAFQAAEAGMEFGINYLKQNEATITGSAVSGYINYSNASTTNITLANNSKFTVVYTNPTANNYNVIKITSTGTSDDSSSTRIISQLVQKGGASFSSITSTIKSQANVALSGNAEIKNMNNNSTITTGGTISFDGNSESETSTSSSDRNHNGTDISQNNSSLANMSQTSFFATYFGTTSTSTISSSAGYYYSNSSNTNYSSTLDGKTGTTIWIDQTNNSTASINGNVTIGSSANPVILVVNGNLSLSGNITIYGFVFVLGSSGINSISGNIELKGAIASTNTLSINGNAEINYSSTILSNLQNQSALNYYAKIPGSWKDF